MRFYFLILFSLFFCNLASAQDSLEEELARFEKEMRAIEEKLQEAEEPVVEVKPPKLVEPPESVEKASLPEKVKEAVPEVPVVALEPVAPEKAVSEAPVVVPEEVKPEEPTLLLINRGEEAEEAVGLPTEEAGIEEVKEEAKDAGYIDVTSEEVIAPELEPNVYGPDFEISPLRAIPPLKGEVKTDPGFLESITSDVGWSPAMVNQCQGPLVAKELCGKSLAIKEVLKRFSGTDAFYDNLCEDVCEGGEALLTSLVFNREESVSSLVPIWNGRRCVFRIQKGGETWKALQLSGVVCRCIKNSCDKETE